MKTKAYKYKKILKNEEGFFAVGLVFMILLSFIPVVNYVNSSVEGSGATSLSYQTEKQAQKIFNDIQTHFYNRLNCVKTFGSGPSKDYVLEAQEIKDFKDQVVPIDNSLKSSKFHLKKLVLCIDQQAVGDPSNPSNPSNPDCVGIEGGLLRSVKSLGSYENHKALLYVKLYSEWEDEDLTKRIPIFVKTQTNGSNSGLLSCSTASPMLRSSECQEVTIEKVCCRYIYKFHLPRVNTLTPSDHSKLDKTIKFFPRDSVGYIPSSSDPDNQIVDEECSASYKEAVMHARCAGSHWDYTTECIN